MSKKIVIALGGNALGSTLHEQADAVQITAKAIVDLIAEGHEVVVAHGNGPQVGIINNAMLALMHDPYGNVRILQNISGVYGNTNVCLLCHESGIHRL